MERVKQVSSEKTIVFMRRIFYNTPVMRWRLTADIHDKVFRFGMPDLSKPIPFRGARFFIDPEDRSYAPSMVGGYYEKHELDIFEKLAKDSRILFDIGANVGMYSVLATKSNPAIKCYAFEPVSENVDLLGKNIRLNRAMSKIKLVAAAVSSRTGVAMIHLSAKQSGTHSLSVDRGGLTREVKTVAIDSYCTKIKKMPDLIKIDVEGHEASVFEGMKDTLKSKPTIFMEYVPELNKDMEVLIGKLAKIYTYCYVVDDVKGKTIKMPLRKIDQNKRYNIILSKNKAHTRTIELCIHRKKGGVDAQ